MDRSRIIYISLVLALIEGRVLLRYVDPFFVRALRLVAFDNFQRLAPEPYDPNLPIRIVDIDEKSLSIIGQWPWPRTTVRDLLLGLTSKGAAVVAFDVLFAEPTALRSMASGDGYSSKCVAPASSGFKISEHTV